MAETHGLSPSGTKADGSISILTPNPLHSGQAPYGELKEKMHKFEVQHIEFGEEDKIIKGLEFTKTYLRNLIALLSANKPWDQATIPNVLVNANTLLNAMIEKYIGIVEKNNLLLEQIKSFEGNSSFKLLR